MTDLNFGFAYTFILVACVAGFLFGLWNFYLVTSIDTKGTS